VSAAKIAHRAQREDVIRSYTDVQATFSADRRPAWSDPQDALTPRVPDPHALHRSMCHGRLRAEDVFRVNDCEMHQALVAAGVGVGFLPRLAFHPVHPGVVVKPVAGAPRRRILAITLPRLRNSAAEVFVEPLDQYVAAYPTLPGPARA
jgi:DNA-binding transcriptional LysR family regulator